MSLCYVKCAACGEQARTEWDGQVLKLPEKCKSCGAGTFLAVFSGLEAEALALRKDAERYRWLRDKAYTAVAVQLMQHMPGEMDGAIDHAMQMDGQDAALRAGRAVGAA